MTIRRVWHGATGTGDGSSWANAYTTLAAAVAAGAAGDEYWLSSDHNEDLIASVTYNFPGTMAAPDWSFSVNRTTDALEFGASISTTTNDDFITVNGVLYMFGVELDGGLNSTANGAIVLNQGGAGRRQIYESCRLMSRNNSFSQGLWVGWDQDAQQISETWLINCEYGCTNAPKQWRFNGNVRIVGGSLIPGFTATTLIQPENGKLGVNLEIIGLDISNALQGIDIFAGTGMGPFRAVCYNMKMPAGWNGTLFAATPSVPIRAEMYNFSDGDVHGAVWVEDYSGSIRSETTVVRTGGAAIARKMQSRTHTRLYPLLAARGPTIRRHVAAGAAINVELHCVLDSASDLNNDEFWIEAQAYTTSGVPMSTLVTSRRGLRSSAVALAASTETWGGTGGFANVKKQKAVVTFTPAEAGYIEIVPCLAKSNTTLYYDPDPVIA